MALSGLVAGGAQHALDEALDRRMREQLRQQQEQQEAARLALQQQQQAAIEADRAEQRAQGLKRLDLESLKYRDEQAAIQTDRNVGLDAANVMRMPGMTPQAKADELEQSLFRNPNASVAPALLKRIDGLTRVPDKKFTSPQRLSDGTIAQFEEGQIPAGTKFYQEPQKAPGVELMQVSEVDPVTGELVTSLVPKKPGEVSRKMRPTTEGERKAAGFYRQMENSIKTIDELEDKLTDAELYQIQSLPQEDLLGMANRGKLSENAKRYLRAFEQFTESRLRPVSGAAINDSEYARDRRTYARQFSETPQLAADRRSARQTALDSLGDMAGAGLKPKPSGGDGSSEIVEAIDAQGNRHRAPKGTPLPPGWKWAGQ